jgi:hypothetical protein
MKLSVFEQGFSTFINHLRSFAAFCKASYEVRLDREEEKFVLLDEEEPKLLAACNP